MRCGADSPISRSFCACWASSRHFANRVVLLRYSALCFSFSMSAIRFSLNLARHQTTETPTASNNYKKHLYQKIVSGCAKHSTKKKVKITNRAPHLLQIKAVPGTDASSGLYLPFSNCVHDGPSWCRIHLEQIGA